MPWGSGGTRRYVPQWTRFGYPGQTTKSKTVAQHLLEISFEGQIRPRYILLAASAFNFSGLSLNNKLDGREQDWKGFTVHLFGSMFGC